MSRKRYLTQIVIGLLVIYWGIMFGGNYPLLYWDVPSLILTPIVPYIILSFLFSFREQKEMFKEIFKTDGTGDKKLLEKSLLFFDTFKKLVLASNVVAIFIGFIGIMGYLSEMTDAVTIGKNLGVLAICPFYTAIFIYLYIEPLKGAARKNLIG